MPLNTTPEAPEPQGAPNSTQVGSNEAPECGSRAVIYDLIATALTTPPTAPVVRAVREMARTLGFGCPEEWSLEDLRDEHRLLFVVPNPRYVAPYESVYRDAWEWGEPCDTQAAGDGPHSRIIKGLLMGTSTLEVDRCYRDAGVRPREDLPDHVGNELRFMAFLCRQRETKTTERHDVKALYARIRDDHLLMWLPLLRERVRESETLDFYTLTLAIAIAVLQNDR